jgi:MFS family permease
VVFVGDALTSLLYGVLVLLAIPKSLDAPHPPRAEDAAARERPPSALRLMAADRGLMVVIATGLVVSFVHHQDMASFPLELSGRGMSADRFGLLISLNGLTCMLLELPVAAVTSRLKAWIPMAFGAALTGLGMAAVWVAPGFAALMVCVLVWTLGEMCYWPVASAFVADLAPAGLQGRYQAAHSFTNSAGLMLAPALGPALFAFDRGALWALCAILGVVAAASFAVLGRARHVRTVEAELQSVAVPAD